MRDGFRRLAQATAEGVGSPWAFVLGVLAILVWGFFGPIFHYSDTWQLIVNTGTSIGTFLMVFLIQHTQNRDARVIHLKLDELIRAVHTARTELVSMEAMTDDELKDLAEEFQRVQAKAARSLQQIEARKLATGASLNSTRKQTQQDQQTLLEESHE